MARMIPLKKDGQVTTWVNTDHITSVQERPDGRRRLHTITGGHYYTEETLEKVVARINAPVQVAQ